MEKTSSGTAKIASLEGLRGLMSFWVLLGHLSLAFGWHLGLLDRNTLAVDVFILLSGFVIARLLVRRREAYGPYILRRAFRLFPLYLLTLAAGTLLLPVQIEAWQSVASLDPHNLNRVALAREGLSDLPAHLLAHLGLVHGLVPVALLPDAPYTLLGQAWSISLEWQFYLLAPLLLLALTEPRRWGWLGAALVALVVMLSPWMTNAYLGNRIELFLAGMASSLAFEQRGKSRAWLRFALAVGAIAVVRQGMLQIIPLVMWFAVILTVAVSHLPVLRLCHRVLSARPLVHLGEISYSIYLIHTFPLFCGIWLARRLGLDMPAEQAMVTVLTVFGSVALAELSWRWLEQPAVALGNRLAGRTREQVARQAA